MTSLSREPSAAVQRSLGKARLPNGLGRLAKGLVLRYKGFDWVDSLVGRGSRTALAA
jgi:hypothetical protein